MVTLQQSLLHAINKKSCKQNTCCCMSKKLCEVKMSSKKKAVKKEGSKMKKEEDDEDMKVFPFHEMGLDDRILKSIAKLGWENPTLIQEKSIPLILGGQDVLCRGRTGSGKTGAFAIPIVQKILMSKQTAKGKCNHPQMLNRQFCTSILNFQPFKVFFLFSFSEQSTRALILSPSRELSSQIHSQILEISGSCGRVIRSVDLSGTAKNAQGWDPVEVLRPLLVDKPDILVGTPSGFWPSYKLATLT